MLISQLPVRNIRDYVKIVGEDEVSRLISYSEKLRGYSITHVNSTSFGGGVAEILYSLIPLMNSLKIKTEWEVIEAPAEFFNITKKIHNALQGHMNIMLSEEELALYINVNKINAQEKLLLRSNIIVVHDPQPLPIRVFANNNKKWIWRCHIDLSTPNENILRVIIEFLRKYDASIFHMKEFIHELIPTPKKYVMPPSIDPLSDKNKELSYSLIHKILSKYDVDPEKPILLQVSRFDPWKDPFGAIDTYRLVKKKISKVQLLLIGSLAHDDPEGQEYLLKVKKYASSDPNIHILTNLEGVGALEVNAFQRAATVVLQLSIREGFGLAVTEALWKGKPVVARPSGGILLQVIDGVTGYLVRNPEEASRAVIHLIRNPELRRKLGLNGKAHVKKNFIITKHIERYLKVLENMVTSSNSK